MSAEENPRRQALVVFSDGQDTYSIMPYEEVLDLAKRSETAIYTIGLRDPIGNTRGFNNAEFVLRQLAVETGGRAFFPDSIADLTNVYGADRRRAVEPVRARLHLQEPASRRRLAPHHRAGDTTEPDVAHQARLLRPDKPVNLLPLLLYAVATVAYALHFARREAVIGRTATTLLMAAALVHTFVIAMQTMEVGHVPIANPSRAVSTFVWLLGLSYLYLETTTNERSMGVFILPIVVGLQLIPTLYPGVEKA